MNSPENKLTKSIGQVTYEAYCATTDWKSAISGAPLPQWEAQADRVKTAWEAAGAAASAFTDPPMLSTHVAVKDATPTFKDDGTLTPEAEELVLALGIAGVAYSADRTDQEHANALLTTLGKTRQAFNLTGDRPMLEVCNHDGTLVFAHTGTSPTSRMRAMLLAKLWNVLHSDIVARRTAPKPDNLIP